MIKKLYYLHLEISMPCYICLVDLRTAIEYKKNPPPSETEKMRSFSNRRGARNKVTMHVRSSISPYNPWSLKQIYYLRSPFFQWLASFTTAH